MERLDQNVADTIRILAQSVQDISLRSCIEEACPTRLTRNQFLILNLLNANGAFPIGEIAGILDISSPRARTSTDWNPWDSCAAGAGPTTAASTTSR